MFDFETQLKKGKKAEARVAKYIHENVVELDLKYLKRNVKGPDFKTVDGQFIELKSEVYSCHHTANFFVEHFSNESRETLGGVWRAAEEGVSIYIHYFVEDDVMFVFDTMEFKAKIEEILEKDKKIKKCRIKNKTYFTTGYVIPRRFFKELYHKIDISREMY